MGAAGWIDQFEPVVVTRAPAAALQPTAPEAVERRATRGL